MASLLFAAALVVGGSMIVYTGVSRRREHAVLADAESGVDPSGEDDPAVVTGSVAAVPGPDPSSAEPTRTDAADSSGDFDEQVRTFLADRTDTGGAFRAPFSDDDCVAAEWRITDRYDHRPDDTRYENRAAGTSFVPFGVEGMVDRTLVAPTDASQFDLADEEIVEVGVEEDPPAAIAEFVAEWNALHDGVGGVGSDPTVEFGGEKQYRFTQRILRPGDDATVLGPVAADAGGSVDDGGAAGAGSAAAADEFDRVVEPGAGSDVFLVSDKEPATLREERGGSDTTKLLLLGAGVVLAGVAYYATGFI